MACDALEIQLSSGSADFLPGSLSAPVAQASHALHPQGRHINIGVNLVANGSRLAMHGRAALASGRPS
eukprot:5512433-Pyramimonas_sp.AAC.1